MLGPNLPLSTIDALRGDASAAVRWAGDLFQFGFHNDDVIDLSIAEAGDNRKIERLLAKLLEQFNLIGMDRLSCVRLARNMLLDAYADGRLTPLEFASQLAAEMRDVPLEGGAMDREYGTACLLEELLAWALPASMHDVDARNWVDAEGLTKDNVAVWMTRQLQEAGLFTAEGQPRAPDW